MDQENVGTIIPGEDIPAGAIQNTVEHDETPDTGPSEIETRARAMGWRPQDEFNGDQSKWRSAEDFVAKGENDLPVLRENLRRTTDQITQLQTRLAKQDQEFKQTISRVEKMSETALQRQREQLDANWSAAMRNATADGDVARYDQLEQGKRVALDTFDKQLTEVKAPPPAETGQTERVPLGERDEFKNWHKKNPWYGTDEEMSAVADAYSQNIARKRPDISLEDNMRETEQWVRKRYADKFSPPSNDPPAVEGGGSRMSATMGRGKGWNEIPADAKAQAAKFIKDGLFKDQSDYAKEYWSQ